MMKVVHIAAFSALSLTAPPLTAQQLNSVQLHAGMVDLDAIVSGEKRLPLVEPIVATEPAFDGEITSYTVHMPYGVDGVTLVVEASRMNEFGGVDLNGVGGEFEAVTYQRNFDLAEGKVMSLPLQSGDNNLRLGIQSFGSSSAIYEFVITRPLAPAGDTTLAALQLGGGELSPAFDPNFRMYRTRIVGDGLTVMSIPSTGASVTVQGTAADGTALVVDGDLVSGLTAGDNTVNVVVLAQNGTSDRYTLTVEVSDDVREVAAGDVISWPADCDSDIGCDRTLNGVDGRFVCVGGGFRTETANVQFSVGKICLLSLGAGDVVNSASGWAFAAFPASRRGCCGSLTALRSPGRWRSTPSMTRARAQVPPPSR